MHYLNIHYHEDRLVVWSHSGRRDILVVVAVCCRVYVYYVGVTSCYSRDLFSRQVKSAIYKCEMHPLREKRIGREWAYDELSPRDSTITSQTVSIRFCSLSVCLPHVSLCASLRATKITVYLHICLSPPRVHVAGMEPHAKPLPPRSWSRSQEVNPGAEHGSHEQKWWAERRATWPTLCF